MGKIILVVGNSFDSHDSQPERLVKKLAPLFQHITFLHWDPTEELPTQIQKNIVLIDTVKGIQTIQLFHGLNNFLLSPRNTVHDFDLPVALSLLKKIDKIGEITIIGIPYGGSESKNAKELKAILQSM